LSPPAARIARALLFAILIVSGAAIAWRIAFGPFHLLLTVNSPLNAESIFGLALTALLAMECAPDRKKHLYRPPAGAIFTLVAALALAALVWAAFAGSVQSYFLSDDFGIVTTANSFSASQFLKVLRTPGEDNFFRPLGWASYGLTAAWAGFDPARWHLVALVFHLANSLLVFWLAFRLSGSRFGAAVAAALFAIHGTRPEAAVWIASRFDLQAAFFTLLGLILFLDYAETGGMLPAVLATAAMAAAMLTKESALVFPLLAVLVAAVRHVRRPLRPAGFVLLFGTALAAFVYRWVVLGGIGGYFVPGTSELQAAHIRPLGVLKVLGLRLWSALYFPINWSTQPAPWLAAVAALYLACLLLLARSRPRLGLFWFALGFIAVAAIPPMHVLLIGADLQKARLLYLPSAGFAMLIAFAIEGLESRRLQITVAVGALVFNFGALQHNLRYWNEASVQVERACAIIARRAPVSARVLLVPGAPGSVNGVYFLQQNFTECVQLAGRDFELVTAIPLPRTSHTAVLPWSQIKKEIPPSLAPQK
jgi:hypothetical protein